MLGATVLATPAMAGPGDIDPEVAGSLTIHKYQQPSPAGDRNDDGTPITIPGSWVELVGVDFRIQQIDVDLSTNAGWDAVAAMTPATAPIMAAGADTTVTSVIGGVATDLPVGAYLVTELASTGVTNVAGDPVTITTMAAPFIVTVPIPTGNGTWNYDVNVYPKNSVTTTPVKSVDDPSGSGIGSTLTWSVEVVIPTLQPGQSFENFDIVDDLDSKIEYVAGSAAVTVGATTIAIDDNSTSSQVNIEVTDLAALAGLGGQTLTLTFDTTVIAAGEILNEADVFINDPNHNNGITTNEVPSYWGQIRILKHAEGDVTKTLRGATFTVHETEADALADANPISVGGVTEFTTDGNGVVLIPGLFVSNTAGATKTYYLKETVAPVGYNPNPNAIPVVLTAGSGVATPVEVSVPNPQKPEIELPLTGGTGTVLLSVTGAGLLLAGIALARVARRRTETTI